VSDEARLLAELKLYAAQQRELLASQQNMAGYAKAQRNQQEFDAYREQSERVIFWLLQRVVSLQTEVSLLHYRIDEMREVDKDYHIFRGEIDRRVGLGEKAFSSLQSVEAMLSKHNERLNSKSLLYWLAVMIERRVIQWFKKRKDNLLTIIAQNLIVRLVLWLTALLGTGTFAALVIEWLFKLLEGLT